MKRFIVLFSIFLCLALIGIKLKPTFAVTTTNNLTEGIYGLSDFNPSKNGIYSVSNTSRMDSITIIITNENQAILQVIRLSPGSEKHNTVPILPEYRVVLLGKGEVFVNPVELT